MIKYFGTANQKYLRNIVVYAKAADSILYKDLASGTYSNAVSKAELIEMFNKGILLIKDGDTFVAPNMLDVSTNYAAIHYVKVSGEPAAASVVTYYSGEYTAG